MIRRGNKFNARKVVLDGITFDSGIEARRYNELFLLAKAGEISDLEVHPPSYPLVVNGVKISVYTCDFRYKCNGVTIVEDVKGKPTRTRDYILRKKLMLALFGVEIQEWPPKPPRMGIIKKKSTTRSANIGK